MYYKNEHGLSYLKPYQTPYLKCNYDLIVNFYNDKVYIGCVVALVIVRGSCNVLRLSDCEDWYNKGYRRNQVYKIYPDGKTGFSVYCDMKTDGGGWTQYFSYRNVLVLGNDRIHLLTRLNSYKLRLDLEDFNGTHKYASYSSFFVGSEATGYVLNLGGYEGTAGDSLKYHNGVKFTTKDKDNDSYKLGNCAAFHKGGWWYRVCHNSNLNGIYMKNVIKDKSMNWLHFHNSYMSYKENSMEKRISIGHGMNTNTDLARDHRDIGWRTFILKRLKLHNWRKFTTKDKDNDIYKPGNCAVLYKCAWSYCECYLSNVIQRRFNGKTDFYRTWKEYKYGFGTKSEEYWLGNDRIHLLTKLNSYKLRVDMEDFKGVHKYASYSSFSVGSESSGYVLNVGGYKGTAGDRLKYHNGRKFTTKDKDNDNNKSGNCVVIHKGAWWHDSCYHSNLNGIYMNLVTNDKSMNWYHFHNNHMSLKIKGTCDVIKPSDCEDWYNEGYRKNRVYKIYPDGKTGFDVFCDMKTDEGGWTVIQRRFNGKTDFYRT
ncbi:hypothetical protein KUTeg_011069 [Tegillarca granosa]|uniref:Fibrinogen C-terminal domain-containing protein n=1 Tax=Tegillarca granosa TaxID=220873 RepID=A0ABQ9F307_TEGGR|nr:hypothetical protein KUTeg_011069 [Tegillarca granosa]